MAWASARIRTADLRGGSGDGDEDSLFVDQLTGQESDISTTPHDSAATDQPSRFGRAQELDVKIGGWCELSWSKCRRQRRAEGGIEHGGQEAALHHPHQVQEPLRCREGGLDSPRIWVHGDDLEPQRHRCAREFGSAFDGIPERASSRHWDSVAEPS